MSEKIRGFQWAMTFRGFEFYASRKNESLWIGRPNTDIELPESTELVGTFDEIADIVNEYWVLQGR